MIKPDNIKAVASDLSEKLKNGSLGGSDFLKDSKEELEQSIQIFLESNLRKLNFVSRDEFDAQTEVLKRTRVKLEELETLLKELEKH